MSFLGHIMRKHGLENIVVTGKIEAERSRGKPRLNFTKSLSQLLKISEVEIIERTRNREEWRTMTANVRIGYGTYREREKERNRQTVHTMVSVRLLFTQGTIVLVRVLMSLNHARLTSV